MLNFLKNLYEMSDEHDVIRGDSSSSISTSESFEKVGVPGASESSSRDSPAVSGNNSDAEHSETAPSVTISEGEKVEDVSTVNEQFFSPAHSRRAITYLVMFTAAMFVLPLLTMYSAYQYFRDHLHMPTDQAMLYAGMCGIAVVIIIVAVFVYIAWREEREDEKLKKLMKKSE